MPPDIAGPPDMQHTTPEIRFLAVWVTLTNAAAIAL